MECGGIWHGSTLPSLQSADVAPARGVAVSCANAGRRWPPPVVCRARPDLVRVKLMLPNRGLAGGCSTRRGDIFQVRAVKKTFSSFDDMLANSELPVLVDFYATWCGPCQYMVPVLNEIGKALKDELRIVKIDTEKYPQVASRYGVQALPTFIIFRDGQPIDRLEGALPADKLISHIKQVIHGSRAKSSSQ